MSEDDAPRRRRRPSVYEQWRSTRLGGDQIEYEDQEPTIHRMFVDEAARHGVEVHMEEFVAAATR
jgi:hypothetical protein